ncbi:MAG: VOC family protein [Bacillota bacterium]
MGLRFESSVIFVKDVSLSKSFYTQLLGMQVLSDFGPCVGFAGGLSIWQVDHAHSMLFGRSDTDQSSLGRRNLEICFESDDIDAVVEKLVADKVPLVHPLTTQPWQQRVIRFYDPDGHVVEVGEPMWLVIRRLAESGLSHEDVAKQSLMPLEVVKQILR